MQRIEVEFEQVLPIEISIRKIHLDHRIEVEDGYWDNQTKILDGVRIEVI